MLRYITKRFFQSLLTVLLVVSVVFLLLRLMPTDYYFTEEQLIKFTDQQKNDMLEAAGLLDNPFVQLGRYFMNMIMNGDLGESRRIMNGKPVLEVIGDKFAVSMRLGLIALGISLVVGVVIGIFQARFKDGLLDNVGTAYTVFVNAVPGLVSYSLILIFGARVLGLPSMYSMRKPFESSILPVVCLSIGSIAGYMLWMRRYMVDEMNKDYIRLAKLKGLSDGQVMFRHVMKNAFLPMAQFLPQSVLTTVGGSLLIERFFAIPGMGPLLTDSISKYDFNLVQALIMLYASLGVFGLFLGDLFLGILDPRIQLTGKGGTR